MTDMNNANFVKNAMNGSRATLRWDHAQSARSAENFGASPRKSAEMDMGKAGSVRVAIIALLLTVISALAIFPFILPTIPV